MSLGSWMSFHVIPHNGLPGIERKDKGFTLKITHTFGRKKNLNFMHKLKLGTIFVSLRLTKMKEYGYTKCWWGYRTKSPCLLCVEGFPCGSAVKNPPAMSLEDPLEEGMANHSSIRAWEIPWTEEPGRLWSMGLDTTKVTTHACSVCGSVVVVV